MNDLLKKSIDDARLDAITRQPLAGSRKVYVAGVRYPYLRVPMREIRQAPTVVHRANGEATVANPPLTAYDSSGPYTDPEQSIDLRKGLRPIREDWIRGRGDAEELEGISSEYGRACLSDRRLDSIRFGSSRGPLRAKSAGNVTQLHYARQGIVTPEMEFVAVRENQKLEAAHAGQHPGQPLGASIPREITPEFVRDEITRGRAILLASGASQLADSPFTRTTTPLGAFPAQRSKAAKAP